MLTLAVEAIRARGKTHALQWLGSALSFIGVGLIVANGLQLSRSAAGYACMVGGDFCWVAYTDLAARYSQVALVFWQSLAGLAGLLPLLLFDVGRMGKPTLMILAHVAVGVSLGEKLGALQFGGGAMVVVGVLVATRRRTE